MQLLEPGARVVAGISGGPDSVALVSILLALAPSLRIQVFGAHLNHGMRGEESDRDQAWVKELCERMGVELLTERLEQPPEANIESRMRDARYRFLLQAAGKKEAKYVAVGHHADDLAETVLINLMRGAGPAGLSGMAPLRAAGGPGSEIYIVRPLLPVRRAEIMGFLEREGLSWREDSSNLDPRFMRNRVRRELLPLMEEVSPGASEALVRAAEVTRAESEALQGLAKEWLREKGRAGESSVEIELAPLRELAPGFRMAVYREAVCMAAGGLARIERTHLAAVDELALEGPAHGSLDLPGIAVRREYEVMSIVPAAEPAKPAEGAEQPFSAPACEIELPIPGSISWPGPRGHELTVSAELIAPSDEKPDFRSEALLDPEKTGDSILVRTRRLGERYRPGGMTGARKLKDVFNDLKVPPRDRGCWPLISCQDRVVWVPGMRPAQGFGAPRDAAGAVRVRVSPPILTRMGGKKRR